MNTLKIYLITLLFILTAPTLAAQNKINIKDLQKCSIIENNDNRLICYDQTIIGKSPTKPKQNLKQQIVAKTEVTKKTPDDFGLEHKKVYKDKSTSIRATVTSITKTLRGKLVITLDNNQQWRQKSSKNIYLKENDTVLIKRGLLSSYMLNKEGQNQSIRVYRTK